MDKRLKAEEFDALTDMGLTPYRGINENLDLLRTGDIVGRAVIKF